MRILTVIFMTAILFFIALYQAVESQSKEKNGLSVQDNNERNNLRRDALLRDYRFESFSNRWDLPQRHNPIDFYDALLGKNMLYEDLIDEELEDWEDIYQIDIDSSPERTEVNSLSDNVEIEWVRS